MESKEPIRPTLAASVSFDRTLAGPAEPTRPPSLVDTRAETFGGERRASDRQIQHGKLIGRYMVLSPLGSGGMGVVYAAYDPQLDRKVALKLLHPEAVSASGATQSKIDGQERLLREAQAMARLHHPNVVAVHDVGKYDERIFIAMEFVDGGTLKQWLRARPRTRQEVLAVFAQAGRGLQAAHEAGLVHRDFKPDNVLVSDKGRAQVLDFGLAKQTEDGERPIAERPSTSGAVSLNTALTQVGAILGTPAYMSPEQHLGEATDARTDQFSFCVALYEALYGTPPFHGDSMAALATAVLSGEVAEAPRESSARVPPWLRKILLRGLAVDPADRYPSLAVLLDDLARDPSSQRRRWIFAVGAAAAVALGAAGWAQLRAHSDALCEAARDQLQGVWDPGRKQQVQAAFAAAGDPAFTAETFRRVEAALDLYAATWTSTQIVTCRAAQTAAAVGDELGGLRSACLARRLNELRSVVDVLARADRQVVERAVNVVAGLGDVAACSDEELLRSSVVPPPTEAVRAQASELRSRLDAARAEARSGQYGPGLSQVQAVAVEARALAYAPLLAEAQLALGDLEAMSGRAREAEAAYADAIRAAAAGRHPRAAAEAWVQLVDNIGGRQAQAERALGLRLAAEAALAWDGSDPVLQARFLTALARIRLNQGDSTDAAELAIRALALLEGQAAPAAGDVGRQLERANVITMLGKAAYSRGEFEQADGHYQSVLAIRREALGPDHPDVASALNDLGDNDYARGRYAEARAALEQALVLRTRVLGPDHPDLSNTETSLGALFYATADYRAARDHYARAVAIRGAALGPDHPRTAGALMNLGNAEIVLGDLDRAYEHYEAARAIQERVLGPEHPELAYSLTNLGFVLRNFTKQDRLAESIRYYERALQIREKTLAPDDPTIGHTLDNLGEAQAAAGKLPQALVTLGRALQIREKTFGPDHPDVAATLLNLGDATARSGAPQEALALLRRALQILGRALGPDHPDVGLALIALARVEVDAHDPAAAGHAEQAVKILEAAADVSPGDRAEAQFLLARTLADRPRALELANLARENYARDPNADPQALTRVDAWLKKQGQR
ncbi:serine/threonine-protein kinase [Nannocystis bainbridge]|uniref:Serine/threonine-protein kinase n=1 Tax=Nannocystis bainbridge TaxID=2995303 RepID=A0ABT5DVU3_9BACT|nr:serine/threonine-protein kinase [Nannocystis bainbridge]MDC0717758.1 serine/threonine-protein kinase [Nannocystis bainbridge]